MSGLCTHVVDWFGVCVVTLETKTMTDLYEGDFYSNGTFKWRKDSESAETASCKLYCR